MTTVEPVGPQPHTHAGEPPVHHVHLKSPGPHQGQPVLHAGAHLQHATVGMVMLHGRGAGAEDILALASVLHVPGAAYLAPHAAEHQWYPKPFTAPLDANEPWLSASMAVIDEVFSELATAGIPAERTVLLGFSQGACLALEYAARHARRYCCVAGLSGGLIGPDDQPRNYAGNLAGTPVFLGCSNDDPYVPEARVRAAAETLRNLGGDVTTRIYSRIGHTVTADELALVRGIMCQVS